MRELQSLGAQNAVQVPGGVAFGGGWEVCYRANLWSRIASRVLWKVHSFSYANEADVYEKAKAVDWPRFFTVGRIGRDQVQDYATRRGIPTVEAERWLRSNLGYETE